MPELRFEWDEKKAATNARKHGVTFEEAKTAFYDEEGWLIPDPEHSKTEDRFLLLGMSGGTRLLLVCHCYRQGKDVIRIISARRASRPERTQYEGRLKP